MKTSLDPRHKKRQKLVEELFELDFKLQNGITKKHPVFDKKDFIDEAIHKSAGEFPIDKINKIDLAILRLAVFELLIEKKEPPKVIIDEAIELGKEFGGETSPGFINGALGNIIKNGSTKI